ncbi:hypothetical protein BC628DRAFT_1307940 [Trametes gibbosa]|nr:hypothetical protein BC628DRAFT_1307940 [Trametes gibbosa]
MLGQRIIEFYPEFDHEGSSLLQSEPLTGLTVRRIKSAGLRIVTESEAPPSPDVLRDDTNVFQPSNRRNSYLSIRTPDTSHTFGIPNPSMLSPAIAGTPQHLHPHTPSSTQSSSSAELASRRLSRYSRAESALQSAVEASSAEMSPQELKIRALEQATASLREQARDAQACAERLRACLASKDLSPDEVSALQRARWLEERKSSARQAQSAHTQDLMAQLSSPVEESPIFQSPYSMTRREANLSRFMQRSPTRITFLPTRNPPVFPVLSRRKTLSQVRPMRLRASAMDLALRSPMRTHARSRSLDGSHSRSNSDATDATCVSQGSSGQTAVAQTSLPQMKTSASISPFSCDDNGIIRIEKLAAPRPRDELLALMGDVPLPDYAVDLLEDLVASSMDISLQEITVADGTSAIPSGSTPDIASSPAYEEPLVFSTHPRASSRIRSQSDITSSSYSPSPSSSAHPRPAVSSPSKLSFRHSLAFPRFSSLRRSSPSLVPVTESADSEGYSRPHSSLSGRFVLDSSSVFHEPDDHHRLHAGAAVDHRRFSVVSFRKLQRGDSEVRPGGIIARFKRRISTLG